MDEVHPKAPTTTYAAGKAAADLAVESYVRMFDLDAFIVRPLIIMDRDRIITCTAGVIPKLPKEFLMESSEIRGDGLQTRLHLCFGYGKGCRRSLSEIKYVRQLIFHQ